MTYSMCSSGYEVDEHFANVGKMIELTKGAERKVADNHFAEVRKMVSLGSGTECEVEDSCSPATMQYFRTESIIRQLNLKHTEPYVRIWLKVQSYVTRKVQWDRIWI